MLGLKREIKADGSIMFRIISISQYINMYARPRIRMKLDSSPPCFDWLW